jgi:hypothetical protein
VALTPDGAALRTAAERVPAQIVERLGMPVAELERIRDDLTALIAAATVEP